MQQQLYSLGRFLTFIYMLAFRSCDGASISRSLLQAVYSNSLDLKFGCSGRL